MARAKARPREEGDMPVMKTAEEEGG